MDATTTTTTTCALCRGPVRLPFAPRLPKLCERCCPPRRDRGGRPARRHGGVRHDADASGRWSNAVAALEGDR